MEVTQFLKEHVPGFENAYLTYVYDLGVRESRRVIGEYVLTLEDIVQERKFEDVVAMGAYPPDLHEATSGDIIIDGKGWSKAQKKREEGFAFNPGYQIPYRCLIPKDIDNLLVVGRCISATFEAQSGTRGMGPCIATGQAAGTAAALSAKHGTTVRNLDIFLLQKTLIKDGVVLGDDSSVA
jgi:hypothetical protein